MPDDAMAYFERVKSVFGNVRSFADEMREKGIHLALGSEPHCVTCDEPWPCTASQMGRPK